MKISATVSSLALLLSVVYDSSSVVCSAFVVQPLRTATTTASSIILHMAYELAPEPEGGEEVTALSTMTGSRLKNMGVDEEYNTKSDDDDETVYKFWLSATADGTMVKEFRTKISKEAAKNANFPGFRKGQVPPYAQPQMTMFAVQEGIIKTCEAAVEAYGLQALKGSDGAVDVIEDVKDICKGYKVGDDIVFTGTFRGTFDPEKIKPSNSDEDVEEDVVETEDEDVVETEEETASVE